MVRTPESERSMGNTGGSPPNSANQPTVDVSTPKGQKSMFILFYLRNL